ncbi:LysR family transcriptional regulator [Zavarzinia sp.]|uniref:LysR family transcriptional regulator n=1 Tax=Zavarzinia sp. TaxID=2027920 RepID=UPI00356A9273
MPKPKRGPRAADSTNDRLFAQRIDWNLFKLFTEVIRAGGIGAAARRMNRQQPSVSAALKRLEDELGVLLCHRSASGVVPTAAGQALLEICEKMALAARDVPHEVAKAAGDVEGSIRLQMISNLVCPAFERALMGFNGAHPAVEIKFDIAPHSAVIRAVTNGEAEIGIAGDTAPAAGLAYYPLMRETQQLYCGPRHRHYGKPAGHPADFTLERFILTGEDETEQLRQFRRRFGLGNRVGGFAENLHEVRRLIELGLGIGFLPTVVAESPGANLWPLLPAEILPSYHVYVITRADGGHSTPTALLLTAILVELEKAES